MKLQVPEVDFVCRGDGEQLLLDLLERLDDPDTVSSVTWQEKDGTLRHNPNRLLTRDLDQWPFPDRDSLPLEFTNCTLCFLTKWLFFILSSMLSRLSTQ